MKILIEKTGNTYFLKTNIENDDKLIHMLKSEIKRLESAKGVKSQLSGKGAEFNVKGDFV